jgi:hypothetical protein
MSATNPFVLADSDDDEAPPNPFEPASSLAAEPSRTNGTNGEAHIEVRCIFVSAVCVRTD